MKKLILLLATAALCLNLTAQDDPGKKDGDKDTIRIGGMIIVKKGKKTEMYLSISAAIMVKRKGKI